MIVFGADYGTQPDRIAWWVFPPGPNAPGVELRPSQPVLDALSAISSGRRANELDLWRARRLGLVDRAGRLTPEGRRLLAWHTYATKGA